jgi:hypothetical protein
MTTGAENYWVREQEGQGDFSMQISPKFILTIKYLRGK